MLSQRCCLTVASGVDLEDSLKGRLSLIQPTLTFDFDVGELEQEEPSKGEEGAAAQGSGD